MLQTLIDITILVMMVTLAFSPALVYRAIDKYFFQKKGVDLFERDIFSEPLEIIMAEGDSGFNRPMSVERDQKILNNLKAMVKKSKKARVKKMWKIKLGEFERNLQWQTTMEKAKGHETLPVTS